MTRIFAITTRGLEAVSAGEMQRSGCTDIQTGYRRVEALCANLQQAARLRTVDDVFLHLDCWPDVLHTRDQLAQFTRWAAALDMKPALSAIRPLRPLPVQVQFSITANFVGRRNYTTAEIKEAIARGILQQRAQWAYSADDEAADLNLRIFIEHRQAHVGLRLLRRPLHRRPYKHQHLPGALKPPAAAALLELAGLRPGQMLLDPFCGTGTIPIEAGLCGLAAAGGDSDPETLMLARASAEAAGVHPCWLRWDAARLPLAAASVDAAITNPPWDRQIMVERDLSDLYQRAFEEMRRVVKAGGAMLILTALPHLFETPPAEQIEISLYGQNPVIMRYSNS